MNKVCHLLNCLVLLTAVCLTSCGYVSDKPVADVGVYKVDELQSCKIDVSKLGEIFKADQKEQIRCLQENFVQFTKYVRSKNPGSVSEGEINIFIRKFFEGQSDSIIKGLSLIFQLNMLLLKDEADRISKTNISPLFDLLVRVNQEAIIITQVLKDMDQETNQARFWNLRAKFNDSVYRFCDFTLKLIEKSPGLQKQLNIKQFIVDASIKLGTKEINPETIDSLIFLKRILAAGEKEVITSNELKTIIEKLPKILSLSFDLYYVKSSNFDSDSVHAKFYVKNINDLYKIIRFDQNDFELFTVEQMLKLAEDFMKDIDVKKFKPSIVAIKNHLVGGAKEAFSLQDLKSVLDIVKDLGERNYFNNVTYNAFKVTIESNKPIEYLPILTQPCDYDVFTPQRIMELHRDFQDTVVNVRYFRAKKEGVPYYGNEIQRNKSGFIEATLIKWTAHKLLLGYGHKNPKGEMQVSLDEFQLFLTDMKPILIEFRLWSPNLQTFARNAILLADLFQNKSNGDLEVSEQEATEYIQMILTAYEITDKFSDQLSTVCDAGINKDDPVFETSCFNQHFFDTLLNKAEYKKFFPRLNDYILTVPAEDVTTYLKGVEGFARDINDPKLPINKRDGILILGAMLNIESTLIRFDVNKDNMIDNKTRINPSSLTDKRTELEAAFEVYKKAIISLAELKPDQEKYAYSIFLYMVKYMQVPPVKTLVDSAKFLYFHYWESTNYIAAKRINIGTLLYYLVNQNGTNPAISKDKKP